MSGISIYSPRISARSKYIFNLIFNEILGVEHTLITDAVEFRNAGGAKLCYSEKPIDSEVFFFSTPLLFEKGINDQQITVFEWEGLPAFFGTHPGFAFPFDVFAASFYLVSRYEEYLPHIKDEHERFLPKESLAYQKNFLHKPLVNLWAGKLKEKILERFPDFPFPEKKFSYLSSIDVDSVFAFREKGIWKMGVEQKKK